jgi:putative methionine-R-sulfoxide reductase with GAF domain
LLHIERNEVQAVLFVNFKKPQLFDDTLKANLKRILAHLASHLTRIRSELKLLDARPLAESIQILQPARGVTSVDPSQLSKHEARLRYFRSVIKLALDALNIAPRQGLGMIHLYDPPTRTLLLEAQFGDLQYPHEAQERIVTNGQGIVSWVALRQRAILLEDVQKSNFSKVYIPVNNSVRSELAVPMIASGKLLGVLNLESTVRAAFRPESVRAIWCAANNAAAVYQLSREVMVTHRLLELCSRASTGAEHARAAVNDLASLVRDSLQADKCDIWQYDSRQQRLVDAGASYQDLQPGIRDEGWTDWIQEHRQPVWFSDVRAEDQFLFQLWKDGKWREPVAGQSCPQTVNRRLVEAGVAAELGLPIFLGAACVGVAWVKFAANNTLPNDDFMQLAGYFAAQAGMVMGALQGQQDRPDREDLQQMSEVFKSTFYKTGEISIEGFARIVGYVIHRPFRSDLSGDFHVIKRIDDASMGVLLGDGEGHAVTGVLHMLPIIAAFEAFSGDSRSTSHVLHRLTRTCELLQVHGTAVYCVFTVIGKSLWLSATRAGNTMLLIFHRAEGVSGVLPFPDQDSPATGNPLGVPLSLPMQEAHKELLVGDLLVAYTDGVGEAIAREPGAGIDEIHRIVLDRKLQKPQAIAEAIMARASEAAGSEIGDDASVLVLQVE